MINTEQYGTKDKINSITHTRRFDVLNAGGITKKDYINVSRDLIKFILFHEPAVCRRGSKMEKDLLDKYR